MSDSTKPAKRGRGGRPSVGPRTQWTLRCPDELAAAIDRVREQSGMTTNDLVVFMLSGAIEAGLVPEAQPAGQERLPLSA